MLPIVEPLPKEITTCEAFARLAGLSHLVWFDSAQQHPQLGRYSYIAADPFHWIEAPADGSPLLLMLAKQLAEYSAETLPGLPPFQGGLAGLFSYDLGRSLERIPLPRYDEFKCPAVAVGFYDVVLAWDHHSDDGWIISQGFPEIANTKRELRASERLAFFQSTLAGSTAPREEKADPLPFDELAPQFAVAESKLITSNFSTPDYLAAVHRAIEYIYAGDIFQVNLSQRLLCAATSRTTELYLRLRERNPAPFAGYLDLGHTQICSASPERFLSVNDRRVETRPIKGTRKRTWRPEADLFSGDELQASEKDRAENVMIVDLLRNDLSRVCEPDSVCVTKLCGLEMYEYVQHLVSVVEVKLQPGKTPLDLLSAAFPGGSITGAPKVRAMEIISELEPTARGAYCGALGYIGFDGNMDTSILIRTITASRGWWQIPVGGGITAASNPADEYEETWHKAAGMLRALTP